MWKHPRATFRHANACFDVTYTSNSFGARDLERSFESPASRRVIVLGDSFIEGWGIVDAFDNHVYLSNVLRQGFGILSTVHASRTSADTESFYDSFSTEDLDALLHSLNRISEIAGDRNFYIFTIPVDKDLDYAKRSGTNFALTKALRRFADDRENTEFHDLTSAFVQYAEEHGIAPADFTLGCDIHWNGLGNRVAADAVALLVYGVSKP